MQAESCGAKKPTRAKVQKLINIHFPLPIWSILDGFPGLFGKGKAPSIPIDITKLAELLLMGNEDLTKVQELPDLLSIIEMAVKGTSI